MVKDVHSSFETAAQSDKATPITLYKIELPNGSFLRLAAWDVDVTFDGEIYQKTKAQFRSIQQDIHLSVPTTEIVVQNVSNTEEGEDPLPTSLTNWLVNNDIRGKKVDIITVFEDLTSESTAFISERYFIDNFTLNIVSAVFNLATAIDIMSERVPRRTYNPHTCQWVFTGLGCGWTTDRISTRLLSDTKLLKFCSHTVEGNHGCRAHHPSLINDFLPFGGFPGRPTPHTLGVG